MSILPTSPGVQINENDQSQYTPLNAASTKTGFILRSEKGYCNKIIPFSVEQDLVTIFGPPTVYNYMDWFNCWNYTQYSDNGNAVRPMNLEVKNSGIGLTGNNIESGGFSFTEHKQNFYNPEVAQLEMENDYNFPYRLNFINRFITPKQDVGIAVCSSSEYWKSPIANEFSGSVTLYSGNDETLYNEIGYVGDANLLSNGRIGLTSGFSLVAGSKFIVNNNKMFTITNIYNDSIAVNGSVLPEDIALYFATPLAQTVTSDTDTYNVTFNATVPMQISKYATFYLGGTNVYVSNILDADGGTQIIQFTKIISDSGDDSFSLTGDVIYSNTDYYYFLPHDKYVIANGEDNDYLIPAGTSVIYTESDFNFPVGAFITLNFDEANEIYNRLAITTDTNTKAFQVISVDSINRTITLDIPLDYPIQYTATNTPLYTKTTNRSILKGINLYSTLYDSSMIIKNTTTVMDVETSSNINIVKESLISFNRFFDYEPNWIKDEFVTIVCKKNKAGKYYVVDTQFASYRSNARDYANNNMYANEVFFYGSPYVYCVVGSDESLPKVDTALVPLVKFTDDYGNVVDNVNVFGTVYPVVMDIDNLIDLTPAGGYNPNGYTKADIQNAMELFSDADIFEVNILIAHQLDINGASIIAETRQDCTAIVAPYEYKKLVGKSPNAATEQLLNWYGTLTTSNESIFNTYGTYTGIYGNMKYQYDKYNDVNRWMCIAGDIAGLAAQIATNQDPWFAAAGPDNGKIKNCIKLAFAPNKQNQKDLYRNAINIVMPISGEGNAIVMGNKTATDTPSALDRITIRFLLNTIKKAISKAARYGLFKKNDTYTRNRLIGIVDPYLKSVKARRGVYLYSIQCDDKNNTTSVIQNNGLVMDIGILPEKDAEFIAVNINIFGDAVQFTETVGKNVA